jgi:hypothetical protein
MSGIIGAHNDLHSQQGARVTAASAVFSLAIGQGFEVREAEVTFWGLCPECRRP